MNKILMALIIGGFTYFSAEAQTDGYKRCETVQNEVCRKGHSCYPTKYAENFTVCKNDRGYYICCETPGHYNTAYPAVSVITANQYEGYYQQDENNVQNENMNVIMENRTPESQSYPGYNIISGQNGGYYLQKGKMKPCYVGDNVAEQNRNPYHACPSPQYDGPEKSKARNINIVTQ